MKYVNIIKELEAKYHTFGEYLDLVLEAAQQLHNTPEKLQWVEETSAVYKKCDLWEWQKITLPETDGTLLGDMLPMFVLLDSVFDMIDMYISRGFDDVDVHLQQFPRSLLAVEKRTGRPGINRMYFEWISNFIKCMIFNCLPFRMQINRQRDGAIFLKNRNSGETVVMMTSQKIHRSGLIFGSAGCTDEEGSFISQLCETDTEFIGHLVSDFKVEKEPTHLSKEEWECVLRPGDYVLAQHIPSGSDLSPEKVTDALERAKVIAEKYYPEYNVKYIACNTWMYNPKIAEILGEDSKIAQMGKRFLRFPIKSDATDVFGFVFPAMYDGYESLPENTRLERGLKKLYLEGGYLHNYAGVIID